MQPPYNVLFLCTGNSSRSIMAEAILNHRGKPNFHAFSAGSHPAGYVNAFAIRQLEASGISTEGLRSKSWDEFAKPGAPEMNFIFTLCDNAAREVCPVWPGHPFTAHWGLPDPGLIGVTDEDRERAFRDAFFTLERHIELLLSLPLPSLETLVIQNELHRIGREPSAKAQPNAM
jgi:arsenate reductase (thioredoxin)